LGLATVTLMLVPMATLMLATVYVYGAREFTEALLAQPVTRQSLFAGLYTGLALPMAGAFLLGVGVPLAVRGFGEPGVRTASATLLGVGVMLTFVFVAIACCIALLVQDRLRGLSVALGVWLVLGVLYDGVVLAAVAMLADHPLEKPLLALTFANPIDLARVLLLLRLDVAALMGYTGAAFERFFAPPLGFVLAFTALAVWAAIPAAIAAREFRRRDF
jgi:Cu-processing system permease protein